MVLYQSANFSLKLKKTPSFGEHIIVSKATNKSAVKRNLLKRRLRTILKEVLKNRKQQNQTIFLYTKKSTQTLKYKELKDELDSLFKKIKI